MMPVTFAGQVVRERKLWGAKLREYMRNYNHIAGINILGDCLPHEDNFLELAEEKDARGLPKPRLHFTNHENEIRMNRHAEQLMRRIWETAGATDIWAFPRSAHVIGTARMGLSGDDAVVNPDGRAFDVPNLYICDNSVFPSALSVNPALTIMALSLRTADKFLESEKRRDA
ncbi:GMC family oxidoreductase [Hymenobacter sp. HDW8]|uniref:GMC family oxidoreductase n=1 Tax=Hymenobacter sp. HDW8 TaxID=2714932 RepID=UPI00293C0E52|nr:GMC family oxidoreductase [Hymenobacter sp. HDW8]